MRAGSPVVHVEEELETRENSQEKMILRFARRISSAPRVCYSDKQPNNSGLTRQQQKKLQRRIGHLQKTKNIEEAMNMFEQFITSGEAPTESTLSTLLHLCQVSNDENRAKEVLKRIDEFVDNPGISLLTAKLNYYLSVGDHEKVWKEFTTVSASVNVRESLAHKLLELAVSSKDCERISELLALVRERGFQLQQTVACSIVKLSIEETKQCDKWKSIAMTVMEIYHRTQPILMQETVDMILNWISNYWGPCEVHSTTVERNYCCQCGTKMESNRLNRTEHSDILVHARLSLEKEVNSFEDCHSEEREYKRFQHLLAQAGPFGIILDGLNIAEGGRAWKRVLAACNWAQTMSSRPPLMIARSHLAYKFKNTLPSQTKLFSIKAVVQYYRSQGIHMFFTNNRVADDKYFVYATLASGPDALLVSNDKMGDHLLQVRAPLRPVYQKWLRSCRVEFQQEGDHPSNSLDDSITLPQGYDVKMQWTNRFWHIPLENNKWLCVRRTSIN